MTKQSSGELKIALFYLDMASREDVSGGFSWRPTMDSSEHLSNGQNGWWEGNHDVSVLPAEDPLFLCEDDPHSNIFAGFAGAHSVLDPAFPSW